MVVPKTVDEGIPLLEQLLGRYDPKDSRQFRVRVSTESKNQPEEGKPAISTASEGETIYGTPYRTGNAVSFDQIESVRRTISEVDAAGQRKVVRRQQRYMVARFTLRVDESGTWEFDSTLIAHSIPRVIGQAYLRGSVNWMSDGVQLVGTGVDNIFGADQKLIRVATYGRITLARRGDNLAINDIWQTYQLITDPAGVVLPIPDFTRPIGTPTPWLSGTASLA